MVPLLRSDKYYTNFRFFRKEDYKIEALLNDESISFYSFDTATI
jgi:hypothetical protein